MDIIGSFVPKLVAHFAEVDGLVTSEKVETDIQHQSDANAIPPEDVPLPPPQFSNKLFTNYIPNSSEISDIKQYVATVNDKMSAYDERIAELEAALLEVSTKRAQLHQIASAHEALVSPLRRLPPEILQLIFVGCLDSSRNAVMHATEAPVLLGRVCSSWRRISLNTPELWSSLHIVPPNVNYSNLASSSARFHLKRQLIEMWFGRSGACPLDISFIWLGGDSEEDIKWCGNLLEVLTPLCGRWRTLDFQAPLKMFKPFIGLTVDDVSMLEGIILMDNRTPLSDSDPVNCWPSSLAFAEGASKLRTFTLTVFSGGYRLPTIPWHQLTTLYLESNIAFFFSNATEMLSTLSHCSTLETCTLKFPLSHTASLPLYERVDLPIDLPQLHTLCLDGDQHLQNTFHMSNTLMNIRAPNLRKLEILGRSGRLDGIIAPDPLTAIKVLLQRSKCPLERLNIESLTIVADEFIACLRLAPSLVAIKVQNLSFRTYPGNWGVVDQEDVSQTNTEAVENLILQALTISPNGQTVKEPPPTCQIALASDQTTIRQRSSPQDIEASDSLSETNALTIYPEETHQCYLSSNPDNSPLCPLLECFDFTLNEASQQFLCDFVSSRWSKRSCPDDDGVVRIKSVRCSFTAVQDIETKRAFDAFRMEGLDAFIACHVPITEDTNPSPWSGLEATHG